MLLWGMEEDVTLHLQSLEMPLHSCFFPVPPSGPWIKAPSDTPSTQAGRRDVFPGRRKEESSHSQLGSSRQAQSHVLPSISSSSARAVTPLVQGWGGECGFPHPRLCPTIAQRQAAEKLGSCRGGTPGCRDAGGRADGQWAQPDQRALAREKLNDQQLQGNRCAAWETPCLVPIISTVPERCRQAEWHSGLSVSRTRLLEEQVGLADVLHSCPVRDQLRRDTALCKDRLLGALLGPQPSCAAAAFELNSFGQGALVRSKGRRLEGRVEGEQLSAGAPTADLSVDAGPSTPPRRHRYHGARSVPASRQLQGQCSTSSTRRQGRLWVFSIRVSALRGRLEM